MHFYGHPDAFPKAPGAVYDTCIATPQDYASELRRVGVQRFVAVQSVTYGFDNGCMLEGIAATGMSARGVAVVAPDITDSQLNNLHQKGVRGVRAFMFPGGVYEWDNLQDLSSRINNLGWHLQVQFNGRDIPQRAGLLAGLCCPVVFDHVGKFIPPVAQDAPSFHALLRLIDSGRFWVKISAPYESSESGPPDYHDIRSLVQSLGRHAPERLVWGSNWPHTAQDNPPDNLDLARQFLDWFPSETARRLILCENPQGLYDF